MSTADVASGLNAGTEISGLDDAAEAAILHRLTLGLDAVHRANDLRREELIATERGIGRLARQSMAPPANEFWETTAIPRAYRLISEARTVIDRTLLTLADHRRSLRPGQPHSVSETELLTAMSRADDINELGRWWQRRLRRAATLRSIPTVLTRQPGEADLVISTTEMTLLDRAPWSHSDRLLSAFELAHGELARYSRRRVTELYG